MNDLRNLNNENTDSKIHRCLNFFCLPSPCLKQFLIMCCGPIVKHLLTDPVGTSLVVQWITFYTPNTGGPGSIPGQGTRFHMLQLKILNVATKTRHSQIQ